MIFRCSGRARKHGGHYSTASSLTSPERLGSRCCWCFVAIVASVGGFDYGRLRTGFEREMIVLELVGSGVRAGNDTSVRGTKTIANAKTKSSKDCQGAGARQLSGLICRLQKQTRHLLRTPFGCCCGCCKIHSRRLWIERQLQKEIRKKPLACGPHRCEGEILGAAHQTQAKVLRKQAEKATPSTPRRAACSGWEARPLQKKYRAATLSCVVCARRDVRDMHCDKQIQDLRDASGTAGLEIFKYNVANLCTNDYDMAIAHHLSAAWCIPV